VVRVRTRPHGRPTDFVAPVRAPVAAIAAGRSERRLAVGNLPVRDFLDVRDVVDAYRRLLDRGVPAGVYNVASGVGRRVGELLDTLIELSGVRCAVEVDPDRVRPTDAAVGDASRLRVATGWEPRTPWRETSAGPSGRARRMSNALHAVPLASVSQRMPATTVARCRAQSSAALGSGSGDHDQPSGRRCDASCSNSGSSSYEQVRDDGVEARGPDGVERSREEPERAGEPVRRGVRARRGERRAVEVTAQRAPGAEPERGEREHAVPYRRGFGGAASSSRSASIHASASRVDRVRPYRTLARIDPVRGARGAHDSNEARITAARDSIGAALLPTPRTSDGGPVPAATAPAPSTRAVRARPHRCRLRHVDEQRDADSTPLLAPTPAASARRHCARAASSRRASMQEPVRAPVLTALLLRCRCS
jgi:hypothetical protein